MPTTTPLSFAQERIWLVEQLLPGLPTHHITVVYEITGPLDRAALARATQAVVDRHAPLRTTFHETEGRPYALVYETAEVVLRMVPLASGESWQGNAAEVVLEPFDLTRLPLVRLLVYPL